MSSSDLQPDLPREENGGFLPGNARVVMGIGESGPSEMTVHEIEGTKTQVLDENTELAFWSRVRSKAQAKAKEILNQAMAEAEALREQARQEGLAQGLAQAQKSCADQIAVMGGKLTQLMNAVQADRANLWTKHRQEFAALLKLSVEKTLRVELTQRRQEILGALLDQAIEILDTRSGFTVVVHPEDGDAVSALLEAARNAHPALGGWRTKTDPSLTPGGVRLESDAGMVDNTLDSRFEQIADLLDRVEFSEAQP